MTLLPVPKRRQLYPSCVVCGVLMARIRRISSSPLLGSTIWQLAWLEVQNNGSKAESQIHGSQDDSCLLWRFLYVTLIAASSMGPTF